MSAVNLVVGGSFFAMAFSYTSQKFIMALIIPALILSYFTVIQGVEQGPSFTTQATAFTLSFQ